MPQAAVNSVDEFKKQSFPPEVLTWDKEANKLVIKDLDALLRIVSGEEIKTDAERRIAAGKFAKEILAPLLQQDTNITVTQQTGGTETTLLTTKNKKLSVDTPKNFASTLSGNSELLTIFRTDEMKEVLDQRAAAMTKQIKFTPDGSDVPAQVPRPKAPAAAAPATPSYLSQLTGDGSSRPIAGGNELPKNPVIYVGEVGNFGGSPADNRKKSVDDARNVARELGIPEDRMLAYTHPDKVNTATLPAHISTFVETTLMPLVATQQDGKWVPLPLEQAKSNARVSLVGHSFGPGIIDQISIEFDKQMATAGIAAEGRNQIQAQVAEVSLAGAPGLGADGSVIRSGFNKIAIMGITDEGAKVEWEIFDPEGSALKALKVVEIDTSKPVTRGAKTYEDPHALMTHLGGIADDGAVHRAVRVGFDAPVLDGPLSEKPAEFRARGETSPLIDPPKQAPAAPQKIKINDLPELRKMIQAFSVAGSRTPESVVADIEAVFKEKGFVEPKVVYGALLQKEVNAGRMDQAAASVMLKHFEASSRPEVMTGLAQKHRIQLIDEMARLYTRSTGNTVVRIEGDIGNLGGLNNHMKGVVESYTPEQLNDAYKKYGIDPKHAEAKTQLYFAKADEVVGVMVGIVTDELNKTGGTVIGIRKGGDEIAYYASADDPQKITDALARAQERVQEFVVAAGIDNIPHAKYPGQKLREGVGIGLAEVDLDGRYEDGRRLTPLREQQILDAEINLAKDNDGRRLHGILHEASVDPEAYKRVHYRDEYEAHKKVTTGDVEPFEVFAERRYQEDLAALRKAHVELHDPAKNPVIGADKAVEKYDDVKPKVAPEQRRDVVQGKTPIETEHNTLTASLGREPNATEETLIRATVDLSTRKDQTSGTPQHTQLATELLPNFESQYGKARVLHVDVSNVSGGNKLNSALGDVMVREYAKQLKGALGGAGLKHLEPYIASHGGGRFSILIPENMPAEKLDALQRIISNQFDALNGKKIPMDAELTEIVRSNRGNLPKMYPEGVQLTGNITFGEVVNPKTNKPGTIATIAVSDQAVTAESLGDTLKGLEARTKELYNLKIKEENANVGESTGRQSGNAGKPEERETSGLRRASEGETGRTEGGPATAQKTDAERPARQSGRTAGTPALTATAAENPPVNVDIGEVKSIKIGGDIPSINATGLKPCVTIVAVTADAIHVTHLYPQTADLEATFTKLKAAIGDADAKISLVGGNDNIYNIKYDKFDDSKHLIKAIKEIVTDAIRDRFVTHPEAPNTNIVTEDLLGKRNRNVSISNEGVMTVTLNPNGPFLDSPEIRDSYPKTYDFLHPDTAAGKTASAGTSTEQPRTQLRDSAIPKANGNAPASEASTTQSGPQNDVPLATATPKPSAWDNFLNGSLKPGSNASKAGSVVVATSGMHMLMHKNENLPDPVRYIAGSAQVAAGTVALGAMDVVIPRATLQATAATQAGNVAAADSAIATTRIAQSATELSSSVALGIMLPLEIWQAGSAFQKGNNLEGSMHTAGATSGALLLRAVSAGKVARIAEEAAAVAKVAGYMEEAAALSKFATKNSEIAKRLGPPGMIVAIGLETVGIAANSAQIYGALKEMAQTEQALIQSERDKSQPGIRREYIDAVSSVKVSEPKLQEYTNLNQAARYLTNLPFQKEESQRTGEEFKRQKEVSDEIRQSHGSLPPERMQEIIDKSIEELRRQKANLSRNIPDIPPITSDDYGRETSRGPSERELAQTPEGRVKLQMGNHGFGAGEMIAPSAYRKYGNAISEITTVDDNIRMLEAAKVELKGDANGLIDGKPIVSYSARFHGVEKARADIEKEIPGKEAQLQSMDNTLSAYREQVETLRQHHARQGGEVKDLESYTNAKLASDTINRELMKDPGDRLLYAVALDAQQEMLRAQAANLAHVQQEITQAVVTQEKDNQKSISDPEFLKAQANLTVPVNDALLAEKLQAYQKVSAQYLEVKQQLDQTKKEFAAQYGNEEQQVKRLETKDPAFMAAVQDLRAQENAVLIRHLDAMGAERAVIARRRIIVKQAEYLEGKFKQPDGAPAPQAAAKIAALVQDPDKVSQLQPIFDHAAQGYANDNQKQKDVEKLAVLLGGLSDDAKIAATLVEGLPGKAAVNITPEVQRQQEMEQYMAVARERMELLQQRYPNRTAPADQEQRFADRAVLLSTPQLQRETIENRQLNSALREDMALPRPQAEQEYRTAAKALVEAAKQLDPQINADNEMKRLMDRAAGLSRSELQQDARRLTKLADERKHEFAAKQTNAPDAKVSAAIKPDAPTAAPVIRVTLNPNPVSGGVKDPKGSGVPDRLAAAEHKPTDDAMNQQAKDAKTPMFNYQQAPVVTAQVVGSAQAANLGRV